MNDDFDLLLLSPAQQPKQRLPARLWGAYAHVKGPLVVTQYLISGAMLLLGLKVLLSMYPFPLTASVMQLSVAAMGASLPLPRVALLCY